MIGDFILRPRRESNPHFKNRNLTCYPLHHEGKNEECLPIICHVPFVCKGENPQSPLLVVFKSVYNGYDEEGNIRAHMSEKSRRKLMKVQF